MVGWDPCSTLPCPHTKFSKINEIHKKGDRGGCAVFLPLTRDRGRSLRVHRPLFFAPLPGEQNRICSSGILWLYFGFVYGILFDDRIPARHLPWSQTFCLVANQRFAQLRPPLGASRLRWERAWRLTPPQLRPVLWTGPPQLRSSAFRVQPANQRNSRKWSRGFRDEGCSSWNFLFASGNIVRKIIGFHSKTGVSISVRVFGDEFWWIICGYFLVIFCG